MSISGKTEHKLLSHEDWELVNGTHHPAIYERSPEELEEMRTRLRALRDRERTLLRQKQRELRGKADARGGSFPGTADHPARRKQIFAGALKRVNGELDRVRRAAARQALTASARRALAMRRAGDTLLRPENRRSAGLGAQSIPSRHRRSHISGRRVGSVSQQTREAQAAQDSAGAP